ncbi:MAG TPA: molybdopterin-dependent oxidoreductase [Vicinamibacterales bacterium]|jgi:NADH-quinone oxidoreductase subunit G
MDTVTLSIDGRALTVGKGKTVLQAAIENGIHIPHYCYHPALGVDGSCRVCIVRIEKMPKLQTACSTICADGMVVDTQSPEVVAARASVFEFLLLNHPLDCPVCDKGGECPLQDYSYTFGPDASRMDFPRRVFDGEGVKGDVDFGPTLMLNRQRCILCTRCVRFMKDVDGDAQISIQDRGYGSQIVTFQEEGVHSLLSGNLMDVCPVGAITTRDYRFKSRPWDNPVAVDTICTLCSKGCNITAWLRAKPEWAKGPRIARITPRFEPEVNEFWMCDIGRFDYHFVEGDDRLTHPLVRDAAGVLQPSSWYDVMVALRHAMAALGDVARDGTRFLVSAHASLEELAVLGRIARSVQGDGAEQRIAVSWRMSEKKQPARVKFTVPRVDAPNRNGARDLGLNVVETTSGEADLSELRAAVEAGHVAAVYVLDPGPAGSMGEVSWLIEARRSGRVKALVVQGVLMSDLARAADFVLPGASYLEKDACYTNDQGRVQAAAQAVAPPGDAMEDWRVLQNFGLTIGVAAIYTNSAGIRADIGAAMSDRPGYAGLAHVTFARPTVAKNWLQTSNPSERQKWDSLFKDLPPVKFKDSEEASS